MHQTNDRLGVQSSGAAAVCGGALLTAFASFLATKPDGCIDEECAFRSMRESGALHNALLVLGLILIALACVGVSLHARREAVTGTWWRAGSSSAVLGIALVLLGGASAHFAEEAAPFFVVPGIICLAVGCAIVGVLIVRSAILPLYASLLLIVSALALPATNDQNWRILFMVPFGVAWVIAGSALMRERISMNT